MSTQEKKKNAQVEVVIRGGGKVHGVLPEKFRRKGGEKKVIFLRENCSLREEGKENGCHLKSDHLKGGGKGKKEKT